MENTNNNGGYTAYEYLEVNTNNKLIDIYCDSITSFGWQIIEKNHGLRGITLKLKRNAEIKNKAELNILQEKFETQIGFIEKLSKSKTRNGKISAYTMGGVGTAFMAGSVFCVTAAVPLIIPCAILGAIGLVGWLLPPVLNKKINEKMTAKALPKINQAQENIYKICKEAQNLWS